MGGREEKGGEGREGREGGLGRKELMAGYRVANATHAEAPLETCLAGTQRDTGRQWVLNGSGRRCEKTNRGGPVEPPLCP